MESAAGNSSGRPIDFSSGTSTFSAYSHKEMSDLETKKSRRPLKNLPPDRFQPKMLLFWFVLVGAVVALLFTSSGITNGPETLSVQEVLERAQAGNVNQSKEPSKLAVIRSDIN